MTVENLKEQLCKTIAEREELRLSLNICVGAALSRAEKAERERDEAQAALSWVSKLLDRIVRHEALTEVIRAEAETWLLSPVLQEASKHFVPRSELEKAQAACAEMRGVLKQCWRNAEHDPRIEFLNKRIDHALSSDCGKDILDKLAACRSPGAHDAGSRGATPRPATILEALESERKTVHEWLTDAGITSEENGKPICLLRRLRIAIDMLKGPTT